MINLSLTELPTCICEKGKLLPVEDVSREGKSYLKGWFCPACNTSWLFVSGLIVSKKIDCTTDN